MATKITRDIIESYLSCKYKGHLKLTGQQGTQSDYGLLVAASQGEVRRLAIGKILARHPAEEVERDLALTLPALKRGAAYILNATLEDDQLSLAFDGLKRVPGPSKLGRHAARRRGLDPYSMPYNVPPFPCPRRRPWSPGLGRKEVAAVLAGDDLVKRGTA
jgi:hypothetical protein